MRGVSHPLRPQGTDSGQRPLDLNTDLDPAAGRIWGWTQPSQAGQGSSQAALEPRIVSRLESTAGRVESFPLGLHPNI